jgi:exodeoxyribonuclease VII large subunit
MRRFTTITRSLIPLEMAETVNNRKVYSLIEVALSIQKTIADRYKSSFWVKAEMNKLNHYSHSGHCYPELVEKSNGKVIAQLKANLWKADFERINYNFVKVLKEPLKDGIKILFCATISFEPAHGLSLRILDIDPSFSLGELEKEKLETVERLRMEGIFTSNKALKLPLLPKRIAIISVETSKGYSDFLKIIEDNPWGYRFFKFLFPSLLQGDRSVESICSQLKQVRKVKKHFDVVAIIRGGGGDVGLSSYNNYKLAKEIALFPIPVLTGIGHSTNETVVEMVSYKNAITPTELADFLVQKFHDFSEPVRRAEKSIADRSVRIIADEKNRFNNVVKYFRSATRERLGNSRSEIRRCSDSLSQHSKFLVKRKAELLLWSIKNLAKTVGSSLDRENQRFENLVRDTRNVVQKCVDSQQASLSRLEKHVTMLDPVNILKRGFSITLFNGKALKSYTEVKGGDTITTVLVDGKVNSEVVPFDKPKSNDE